MSATPKKGKLAYKPETYKRILKDRRERYHSDLEYRARRLEATKDWLLKNPEKAREYYKSQLKEFKEYRRDYHRRNYLKINGKYVRVDKGNHPKCCQLCGKTRKRLHFHHWIDNGVIRGIWDCRSCHTLCEGVDKGLDILYREIKEKLNRENKIHL
jgi:hypothetical protein